MVVSAQEVLQEMSAGGLRQFEPRRGVRVDLQAPKTRPSGRSEPAWSTPAERFLEALLPDLTDAEPGATFGVGLDLLGASHVSGAVADALLAVDALRPASPLLANHAPRRGRRHHEITGRYAKRVNRRFASGRPPRHVAAVGAAVPLEHAVAVFDAVVIRGRDVWLHLYIFPDAVGETWPGSLPPFHVDATDDLGHQHQTIGATLWEHTDQGRATCGCGHPSNPPHAPSASPSAPPGKRPGPRSRYPQTEPLRSRTRRGGGQSRS